jgi:D-alanine-D-alanine ligase
MADALREREVSEAAAPGYAEVSRRMRSVASKALELAPRLELLFVTNIRADDIADLGPDGVLNAAQYYTRREADDIVRAFRELGLTVTPFFDELAFFRAVTREERSSDRQPIVFTTAEGGTGSGRRALIPALCSFLGLPVFNSGAHACSLARHKFHANAVLRIAGVRVPATWKFADGRWAGGSEPAFGTRVIVKPMWESQCIGIDDESVQVVDADFAAFVLERSRRFAQPALVQEFVSGEEVGVSVLRIGSTYALPPMAFRHADGRLFDRRPKTFRDYVLEHDVAHVPLAAVGPLEVELRRAAVSAFDALEMRGTARIDFRVDADGRAWAFDTNESPPPLPTTSYAKAMEQLGFEFHEMLAVWLGTCLADYGIISGV